MAVNEIGSRTLRGKRNDSSRGPGFLSLGDCERTQEIEKRRELWDLIRLWGGRVELVYLRSASADGPHQSPGEIFIIRQTVVVYYYNYGLYQEREMEITQHYIPSTYSPK